MSPIIGGEENNALNVDGQDLMPCSHWIHHSYSLNKKRKSEAEIATQKMKLIVGSKVEVRSDEDGYEGAMYAATLVGRVKEKLFLVEYHTIKTDDLTRPLQELVEEENIRPYPPKTRKMLRYRKRQAVDVWYHEGWWEGVVSKFVDEYTYMVYFATTNEELMYRRSCLRPHQDWIDTPLPKSMF